MVHPYPGDILYDSDGKTTRAGLRIIAAVDGPANGMVYLNGQQPFRSEPRAQGTKRYFFRITLSDTISRMVAEAIAPGGAALDSATLLWDRDSFKRYRFSVDDNILFLKDLAETPHRSIFDHWYMAFWLRMHRRYGVKVHFNIYFRTEGFDLTQMPDRYRTEWQRNADWIRLTFHGLQDEPPRPYIDASYEKMKRDFLLVTNEIKRFAGQELLSPFTTIHWGEAPVNACRALRDNGIRGLVGYFELDPGTGRPIVSYYLDKEKVLHLNGRDCWYDADEGLLFVKHDLVVNAVPLKSIAPHLESVASDPHRSEVMEVMVHEQYFRPELGYFQPDIEERVAASLEWLRAHGYRSVFYDQGLLGAPSLPANWWSALQPGSRP